jgi:hypothetical protein
MQSYHNLSTYPVGCLENPVTVPAGTLYTVRIACELRYSPYSYGCTSIPQHSAAGTAQYSVTCGDAELFLNQHIPMGSIRLGQGGSRCGPVPRSSFPMQVLVVIARASWHEALRCMLHWSNSECDAASELHQIWIVPPWNQVLICLRGWPGRRADSGVPVLCRH